MGVVLMLIVAAWTAGLADAQSCSSLPNIVRVQIPETDPEATDIANDPTYSAAILTGDDVHVQLTLLPTNSSKLRINQDFAIQYNTSSSEFYLQLLQPVDRDGALPSPDDDMNGDTFQLRCNEYGFNYFVEFRLEILDINDNYPQFLNESYMFSMYELTTIGLTAFEGLMAMDLDGGVNGEIDFEIVPGDGSVTDGSSLFSIPDPSSGVIVVQGDLDFDVLYKNNETSYWLNISATDRATNGSESRSNYTMVEVLVFDVDDNGPEFVYPTCFLFQSVCLNPEYSSSLVSGAVDFQLVTYPIPADENMTAVSILAKDQDTYNYSVSFSIETTVPEGYEDYFNVSTFGPDNDSFYEAQIFQVAPIRRNLVSNLRLVLKATENSTNAHYSRAIIHLVTVRGYGYGSGSGSGSVYRPVLGVSTGSTLGYIFEWALEDAYVKDKELRNNFRVTVTDPDLQWFDPVPKYNFQVVPNDTFRVDSEGFVRLVLQPLHSEQRPLVNFTVIVTEESSPNVGSATISLSVSVLDMNDNAPDFVVSHYEATVPGGDYSPDKKGARNIIRVRATDADSGNNSRIDYGVASVVPPSPGLFYVTNAGWAGVAGIVRNNETYVVEIRARDNGFPSLVDSVILVVRVTEGNVGPEIPFDDLTLYVSEGILRNSSIWTVPAKDPDNDVITYSIAGGNTDGVFSIDRRSGLITNIRDLDRETIPEFTLTLSARDPSDEGEDVRLHIIVTDVNDNNPEFPTGNPYVFTVQEEGQPSISLGVVAASDRDEPNTPNSRFYYSISQDSGNYFQIDANSGFISTRRPLDYETRTQHIIVVQAIDSGDAPRTGTTVVTISVTDTDDQVPLFQQATYSTSFPEGGGIGSSVLTVTAVDRDAAPKVLYELSGADASAFTINQLTGVISTQLSLNYDTKSRYVFQVTTADGRISGLSAATATVTVSVLQVSSQPQQRNDFAPVFSGSLTRNVQKAESVQIGEIIEKFTATDSDASNTLASTVRFSIVSVTPSSGQSLFYLNPESGDLVLSGQLTSDRSTNVFNIVVNAHDLGSPRRTSASSVTVFLSVLRNSAPRFASSNVVISPVRQDVAIGTFVQQITAVDTDVSGSFQTLTYAITGDGNAQDYFQIDSFSGRITIREILSRDSALSYRLRIVATDDGGLSATATGTVSVERNLYRPELQQQSYTQTILESQALSTPILIVSAIDRDVWSPHNQLHFTIVGDRQAREYFGINDNGELFLIKSPASDPSIAAFSIEVSVSDRGQPTALTADSRAYVTLRLQRNMFAPTFSTTYHVTVPDTARPGAAVTQVSAVDQDSEERFRTLTYRLIGDGTATQYFRVDSRTGQVALNDTLSSVSQEMFTLRIEADDGFRTGATLVYVTVQHNFSPPRFLSATFSANILETQALMETFLSVSAADSDLTAPSNSVYYELTGDAIGQMYFHVSLAGEVFVKRPLTSDPDQRTSYTVTVRALDRGTPQLTSANDVSVYVTVARNRFPPVFSGTPYSRTLPSSIGFEPVLQVTATDADSSTNFNRIRFYIDGTEASLWTIDANTGQISARNPGLITAAATEVYYITVRATDGVTSTLTVVTFTTSRNQFAPVFTPTRYSVTILETQSLGIPFLTLSATDLDVVSPGNLVTYRLLTQTSLFGVYTSDSMAADIFVRGNLQADKDNSQYILTLLATDRGSISRESNTATVTVNVQRNFFAPQFTSTPFYAALPVSTADGTLVFNVTAMDNDPHQPFNVITYRLLGDEVALQYFRIDTISGHVFLLRSLATATGSFWLTVEARDGGVPSLASTAVIHFSLLYNQGGNTGAQAGCNVTEVVQSSRQVDCLNLLIPLIIVCILLFLLIILLIIVCICCRRRPKESVTGGPPAAYNPTYETG